MTTAHWAGSHVNRVMYEILPLHRASFKTHAYDNTAHRARYKETHLFIPVRNTLLILTYTYTNKVREPKGMGMYMFIKMWRLPTGRGATPSELHAVFRDVTWYCLKDKRNTNSKARRAHSIDIRMNFWSASPCTSALKHTENHPSHPRIVQETVSSSCRRLFVPFRATRQ